MKQPKKKLKVNKSSIDVNKSDSIENFLAEFNKEIMKKLDFIEGRLDFLAENCDALEEKVENISSVLDHQKPTLRPAVPYNGCQDNAGPAISISSRVTFITLNGEEDYPNGSWLGDESNPEARVRCHVSPMELFHINTTCTTAEKMALTLLDYLFDRETQACSNISGMGKHKKKQLDPLFIYGIKCHLCFHFGISEQDWNKIKQNIDSKCRTAFRRKRKGLPLQPKGHQINRSSGKEEPNTNVADFSDQISGDSILTNTSNDQELREENLTFQSIDAVTQENILERVMHEAKLIHSDPADFQILQATPEQVAEIQQTHQIKFLSGGQILATPMKSTSRQDIHYLTDDPRISGP